MEEKMNELMASEEFVQKMLTCEEPEQVQALFAAEGVEISLEEVKAIGAALAQMVGDEGELDEDDLENVAGGALGQVIQIPSFVDIVTNRVTRIGRSIVRFFRRW